MRKKERKPLYMLLIYITFMVIPIFPIFFAVLTKKIFGISLNEDIIFTLDYLALFLITMTLYGKDFFKSFSYFKTNTIRKIGTILLLFFASAVLSILLNQIVDFQTKDTANNMSLIEYLHSNSIIVGIFIVGFCGPVVEEIVFRYILIGIFSKKISLPVATLVSMICFVAIHSYQYPEFLNYVPLTLAMTFAYLISHKQVSNSYAFHAFNNVIMVLLTFYQPS